MCGPEAVSPWRMRREEGNSGGQSRFMEMMRDQKHKTRLNFIAVEGYIYLGERRTIN